MRLCTPTQVETIVNVEDVLCSVQILKEDKCKMLETISSLPFKMLVISVQSSGNQKSKNVG